MGAERSRSVKSGHTQKPISRPIYKWEYVDRDSIKIDKSDGVPYRERGWNEVYCPCCKRDTSQGFIPGLDLSTCTHCGKSFMTWFTIHKEAKRRERLEKERERKKMERKMKSTALSPSLLGSLKGHGLTEFYRHDEFENMED